MTLLHVTLAHDRALIATDTACYVTDAGAPADVLYWPNDEHVAVTKLYPQPHIRSLLTGRGNSSVRSYACDAIACARDFEQAVELLRRMLPPLPLPPGTYKGKPMQHTVHLVGWSEVQQAMCRAEFDSTNGFRGHVTVGSATGWSASLGPAVKRPEWMFDAVQLQARQAEAIAYLEADRKRDPRCLATAEAYARAAVEQAHAEDPSAPYGGRLLVAELTRDGLVMRDCGDLGLPLRRPGAPDIITTARPHLLCIATGAVSESFADETGADSTTIGGSGGSSFKTCATRSWANPLSQDVMVQWVAEINGLHFSSGATLASPDDYVLAQLVCKINGTPVLTDELADSSEDAVPPDAGGQLSRTSAWQRLLGPGDTMTLEIVAGGATDTNAATISWARTRLRTTVLKV